MTSPVSAIEAIEKARLAIRIGGSTTAYAYTETDDDGDYITVEDAKAIILALARKAEERTAQYDRMTDKYTAALKCAEDAARQAEALQRENAEKDARIAKLEAGLKPFADEAVCYDPDTGDNDDIVWATPAYFKIRDLRRARALLGGSENAGN